MPLLVGAAIFCIALAVAAVPAVATKYTGTNRSERIIGTTKADRINGKGGNDLIKGRGGNDTLNAGKGSNKVLGGKGNDKLIGGPLGDTLLGGAGVDRHFGGAGNDLLKAADGRRDAAIDGGPGTNKCIVDTLELSIVRNCGSVQASTPGQRPGGGGGGAGPGPGQGLRVLSENVTCSPLPAVLGCSFLITGDGADEVTVARPVEVGGGGVTSVTGAANALILPDWNALGSYTCTAPGSLRVTIGSESVDVQVHCS